MRSAVHIWTKSAIIAISKDVEAHEEEPPVGASKATKRPV